jgi:hypothetical protein
MPWRRISGTALVSEDLHFRQAMLWSMGLPDEKSSRSAEPALLITISYAEKRQAAKYNAEAQGRCVAKRWSDNRY